MSDPTIFAGLHGHTHVHLRLDQANRHGLITGATGTGKTVSLQTLAQGFSAAGVPVFVSDVKGDLAGLSQPCNISAKLAQVLQQRAVPLPKAAACPVTLWDVFGEQGHPVRATVCDLGPLLLSRMLDLNEVQSGVLHLIFKIADDQGLLLLDVKDLRAMCQWVGEHAKPYTTAYGNVSAASVGAIQRGLLQIQAQGGEQFFGEPMLNIADFMHTVNGQGVVNILAAQRLLQAPRVYAAFLLWLLSELFELLPEVGDIDKPKLVLFFDEAHVLFADAPKVLLERIELVVRLVRSKGVGVYFVTQNPQDLPDTVLGQLGNRVQHALRAFTVRDQKAIAVAANTMRARPGSDLAAAISELAVGEALVSFLDEKGSPSVTERVFMLAPASQLGPISPEQRQELLQNSIVAGVYESAHDRASAFELLQARTATKAASAAEAASASSKGGGFVQDLLLGSTGPRGGQREGLIQTLVTSTVRTLGSGIGRAILRGVLGGIVGGSRRR